MRRITAWVGGVAGGIAAYRLFRRRPQASPEPARTPPPAEPDDPAEELRAKLAESRDTEATVEPAVEEQLPSGPVAEEELIETEPESPDERRRRVHEEGRAALDEMKPE